MALSTIAAPLKITAGGDTAAGDDAAIGVTAAEGLILTGQGSTNDVTIKNDADADVIEIPTGTTNVTVAGTLGSGGVITSGAGLVIANGGNIGSVGDADAISIASNGVVTFSQTPVGDNAGAIVQVVNTTVTGVLTGTTVIPGDDTIPQKTEGTEFITVAITPTNSSNKLLIRAEVFASSSGATTIGTALFQDDTANALAANQNYQGTNTATNTVNLTHYMAAGTTSATTFKVRLGGNGSSTVTVNGASGSRLFGGVASSTLTVMEITV